MFILKHICTFYVLILTFFCDNILQNVKIYFIIILGIVKFSFWSMTAENPMAAYACVNLGEASAPTEIRDRSICIDADIGKVQFLILLLHYIKLC